MTKGTLALCGLRFFKRAWAATQSSWPTKAQIDVHFLLNIRNIEGPCCGKMLLSRTRDVVNLCLKLPLVLYSVWANSERSGETMRLRTIAWAFASCLCDKYHFHMGRLISWMRKQVEKLSLVKYMTFLVLLWTWKKGQGHRKATYFFLLALWHIHPYIHGLSPTRTLS